MPALVLDALTLAVIPPETFPISAASDRVAIVGTSNFHGTDASPVTAVALGGQSMALLAEVHEVGADVAMNIWYLLESDIAAMSGATLSITGLADSAHAAVLTMSVQGALQSAPTVNSVGSTGSGGTVSLSRVVDSITLGFSGHDAPDGLTLTNPAEDLSVAVGTGFRAEAGEQAETTDNTSDFIWSHSQARDNASIALNIAPAAAGGGPTITSVDSDDIITDGQTAIAVVGTALDTVTVAQIRTSDGTYVSNVFASYSASSETAATFNYARGDTPLSTASYQLQLLLGDGTDTVTHSITVNPASGFQVTEASGILVITDPESAFAPYTGPDPVDGDQFIVPDATVETAPITPNADTTLEYDYSAISPVPETDSHAVEWWSSDGTSRVWSSGTINVNTPDEVGPVINTVNVPANATYAIGAGMDFTANWDEGATVTGTPNLPITIGGQVRNAAFVSGSGTTALLFRYTVQEGDEDTDGIAVGASIDLNGGTIVDAASNAATLTLNGVGATAGVLVDGIRPVISVSNLNTTDTSPTVSGSAGDATALTLVVNAVQYNPAPSGGSWSQALPELALDTYPMTLDGTDAAGNAAVQASGTLIIQEALARKTIGGGGIARASAGKVWIRRP